MYYGLILVLFLFCLVFVTAQVVRALFPPDSDASQDSGIRKIGTNPGETAAKSAPPTGDPFFPEETRRVERPRRSNAMANLLTILVLGGCFYFVHENHELIKGYLPQRLASAEQPAARTRITPAQIDGHTVVDGINWFKIVATSTEGIPFQGWISEMAIKDQPPKENKAADEMMKKLGLPTVRERAESLKKLQKVGDALKTSLKDMRQGQN